VGVSNIDQSSGAGFIAMAQGRGPWAIHQCSSINAQFWYIVYFPIVLLGTVCVILMDNLGIERRIILNCMLIDGLGGHGLEPSGSYSDKWRDLFISRTFCKSMKG
jgi:hypothetical protein